MKTELMHNGLISVIMPTYNVEAYVAEAVESILGQSYKNLEFIIVDDSSTDRTYEILKKYSEKDSRIRLYRNEQNIKICRTLNRALSYAEGNYIARMDGDDVSSKNRLRILYDYLQKHPKVDLVGSNLIGIDERGNILSYQRFLQDDKYIKRGLKLKSCVSHIWLARRRIYETLDGYRNVPSCEDYDFLLRGTINGFSYGNVRQYVYKNRIRKGNTMSSTGLSQALSVKYIQKLHKLEKKTGKDCFNEKAFNKYIECTDRQKEKYIKACMYLNRAVHERKDIGKCAFDLGRAFLSSKYIALYLMKAVTYRILLGCEKLKL